MYSSTYHLIRSKLDGKYLVARVRKEEDEHNYLLIFLEDYQALSYLNTHAQEFAHKFSTEATSTNQLKTLLKRWGYQGVGMVTDPLIPEIQFLAGVEQIL
jgi:hypothetical protein